MATDSVFYRMYIFCVPHSHIYWNEPIAYALFDFKDEN